MWYAECVKLPRWLSPVRTVEAETGWPRTVCEDTSRRIAWHFDWRELLWSVGLFLLAWPLMVSGLYFVDQLPAESPLGWAIKVTAALFWLTLFGASVLSFVGALATRKARRFLRRYLPAPWCFKCKYPIPPPREGRSYSICPECGEPIPPEIAKLAAGRAAAR